MSTRLLPQHLRDIIPEEIEILRGCRSEAEKNSSSRPQPALTIIQEELPLGRAPDIFSAMEIKNDSQRGDHIKRFSRRRHRLECFHSMNNPRNIQLADQVI